MYRSAGRRGFCKTVSVTVEFEERTLALIDKITKTLESTRSVVIRQFVLEGLAGFSCLPEDTKKALGFPAKPQERP